MADVANRHRDAAIWGDYASYDDVARFKYGRLLWRQPAMRTRHRRHWQGERHPGHQRFLTHRADVEQILSSSQTPAELEECCRRCGTSLRYIAREIPSVFGSFF